jgi:hypothetical protein
MLRRGLGLAAAGVGAVLLASCTVGGPDPTPSTTTPVPTTTVSVKPIPPSLPASANTPTTKGAAEFFKHFINLYNYGYSQLDNQPFLATSAQDCEFCQSEASNMSAGAASAHKNIGGELTVTTAVAAPGDPTKGLVVNAVVDQAAGHSEDTAGKVLETIPAEKNVRMDARLKWESDHWQMIAVRVLEGADH